MPRSHASPRTDGGYSLVEVLLSAALLTAVLASISTLFLVGTQSVKSGRELTKATTIANSAMEQAIAWPFDLVYGFAGVGSDAETGTWSSSAANPAWAGSVQDVAEWTAVATAWREQVQSELLDGELTYQVDGVAGLPTGLWDGLDAFEDADFIRVRITVSWTEARGRPRHVTFEEIVL
jgi:type II secretory pathway pseudopilin PulG